MHANLAGDDRRGASAEPRERPRPAPTDPSAPALVAPGRGVRPASAEAAGRASKPGSKEQKFSQEDSNLRWGIQSPQ